MKRSTKRSTKEEFVNKARGVWGFKYDYSKVVYVNSKTNIIIICPIHGEFSQIPSDHLNGHGCSKCGYAIASLKKNHTIEQFIIKAKIIHGNKYDYSKVDYVNCHANIIIICPLHGEFTQSPSRHLSGHGCTKCGEIAGSFKQKNTIEYFIERAREIHGNKYDYSKVVYVNYYTDVIIICPIHGEFSQRPNVHISGSGCQECSGCKHLNIEKFIINSIRVHGNKYDYSKVIYINNYTKVTIICPIHGEFSKTPTDHIHHKSGCPKCKSSKGEKLISLILDNNKIKYIQQKIFKNCINPKTNWPLKFDFDLPEYNTLIEYNGIQHYGHIGYWHRNGETLESQQYRDEIKKQYAISHGYKYLVIKYTDKNIEEILKRELKYGQKTSYQ